MKFRLRPATVITISIVIGIVMVTSSYFELNKSKEEIFHLLKEQSKSLIETISLSSINTFNASIELENLIAERLLNNAYLIRTLDSLHVITQEKLIEISQKNDLYRINIFNKAGDRILSNRIPEQDHMHGPESINRYSELKPILDGNTKELVIGLKEAEYSKEQRFAVSVARSMNNGGAIVINLNAQEFIEFRKRIGIGKIIQDMSDNPGLVYIILQDSLGIISASPNITSVESIEGDKFLNKALNSDLIFSRIYNINDNEVLEVVKKLKYNDQTIGLFRIGLSLREVNYVEDRMQRRMIVISLILAAISVIVLSIIFTSQNLKSVSSEFSKFKTLTSSVLRDMDEAVIVLNNNKKILLFNIAAEKLFLEKGSQMTGRNLHDITAANQLFIDEILLNEEISSFNEERTLEISQKTIYVILTVTKNYDASGSIDNYIIVIKDISEVKQLGEQSKRNEKLSAMGELASGVAHEIRNPINAIGMIAQRLSREFNPLENREEYLSITSLLRDEVTRINKIITQFLNYAKPLPINKKIVKLNEFFDDIKRLFVTQAETKKINLEIYSSGIDEIQSDPDLLKQALLNIIQNGFDALGENGKLTVNNFKDIDKLIIDIKDNGEGIAEENQTKIFDLYFSTKKDGNGLGLSISQKIIAQLGGNILVKSKKNDGTTFTIKLPL